MINYNKQTEYYKKFTLTPFTGLDIGLNKLILVYSNLIGHKGRTGFAGLRVIKVHLKLLTRISSELKATKLKTFYSCFDLYYILR